MMKLIMHRSSIGTNHLYILNKKVKEISNKRTRKQKEDLLLDWLISMFPLVW